MLTIHYQENGKAFSDFKLLDEAQNIIDSYYSKKEIEVSVSTSNIIESLRVLVNRGKLPHQDICFIYADKMLFLNEKYEISEYPDGFMDWHKKFLRELIQNKIGK